MARLSEDYAKLFHYEGAKTDKHVREHEVYAISSAPGSLKRTIPVPAPRQAMRLPSLRLPRILKLSPQRWPEVLAVNSKLFVVAPLAFTLIVGTGVIARSHRNDDDVKLAPVIQAPRAALAPKVEAVPPKPSPVESTPAARPIEPRAEEPKPAPKEPKVSHRPKGQEKAAVQTARAAEPEMAAPAAAPKPRDAETVATIAPAPRDAAVNIIALPWAEVFIDGTRQGVSPPLKVIALKPGKHRVELRNGSFPPHVQTVELRPGSEINITHRFRR
jgi:hypothetical protein